MRKVIDYFLPSKVVHCIIFLGIINRFVIFM